MRDTALIKGRMRIITTDSISGEVIAMTPWMDNLVMDAPSVGVGAVADWLSTAITRFKVGTGTTPPTDGDTDIETVALNKASIANVEVSQNVVLFSLFATTAELANGTYTEFSMHIGTTIFSRLLISPSYTKGTNQDSTFEYEYTINN